MNLDHEGTGIGFPSAIVLFAISAIFIHKGVNKSGGAGAFLISMGFPFFFAGVVCVFHLTLDRPRNLSAPFNRRSEDIRVIPVIVAELELGDIEGHVFAADLVERADDAALEDAPKPFNRLGVDRADNVAPSGMHDCLVKSGIIAFPSVRSGET